jgi:hypothetical protein
MVRRWGARGISEVIMRQSKGVAELMGSNCNIETAPATFPLEDTVGSGHKYRSAFGSKGCALPAITVDGCGTYIEQDEVDIPRPVKLFSHFRPDDFAESVRVIVRIVELPLHMMNHSLTDGISFIPEGSSAEPMVFQLLRV